MANQFDRYREYSRSIYDEQKQSAEGANDLLAMMSHRVARPHTPVQQSGSETDTDDELDNRPRTAAAAAIDSGSEDEAEAVPRPDVVDVQWQSLAKHALSHKYRVDAHGCMIKTCKSNEMMFLGEDVSIARLAMGAAQGYPLRKSTRIKYCGINKKACINPQHMSVLLFINTRSIKIHEGRSPPNGLPKWTQHDVQRAQAMVMAHINVYQGTDDPSYRGVPKECWRQCKGAERLIFTSDAGVPLRVPCARLAYMSWRGHIEGIKGAGNLRIGYIDSICSIKDQGCCNPAHMYNKLVPPPIKQQDPEEVEAARHVAASYDPSSSSSSTAMTFGGGKNRGGAQQLAAIKRLRSNPTRANLARIDVMIDALAKQLDACAVRSNCKVQVKDKSWDAPLARKPKW